MNNIINIDPVIEIIIGLFDEETLMRFYMVCRVGSHCVRTYKWSADETMSFYDMKKFAAVLGDISLMKRALMYNEIHMSFRHRISPKYWREDTCTIAAKHNQLDFIIWAIKQNCPFDFREMSHTAQEDMLSWMQKLVKDVCLEANPSDWSGLLKDVISSM